MQGIARAGRVLAAAAGLLANLLMLAMISAIAVQVVARFVIGAPTVWAEELARYLLVALTMLGSAVLIERNGHISIDIFVVLLPPGPRRAVDLLRDTVTLTVCGLLVHYGWLLVGIGGRQTSTGLGVKMSLPYLAIPVGAALMAAILLLTRLGRAAPAEA
ncbi:TRAP transporter small permease [Roseivivax sp. CAU 1761]